MKSRNYFYRNLVSLLFVSLILTGCGGSGGDTVPEDNSPIRGAGVKGPLIDAIVSIYNFDSDLAGFHDTTPIATGTTDESAAMVGLSLPRKNKKLTLPLIVELISDADTRDLTTGESPVLRTLRTVITADRLDAIRHGELIYATPLTTLAVDVAITRVGQFATAEAFSKALELAAADVVTAFGFGMAVETDMFTAAPLVNDETTTLSEQTAVARYRTAIEAFAAIVLQVHDAILAADPSSTVTSDEIMSALGIDLADGVINGLHNDLPITALQAVPDLASLLSIDPGLLMVPGTSVPLSDVEQILVSETKTTGTSTNVDYLRDVVDVIPSGALLNLVAEDSLSSPRVVSAISTGNTSILLTFNKSMDKNSAEIASHYSIVQTNINGEVGALFVNSAELLGEDGKAVKLTTSPQNEVTYTILVTNVTDTFGNQIDIARALDNFILANSADFAGSPPAVLYACSADAYGDLAGTSCSSNIDCWDPAYNAETDPEPAAQCNVVASSDFIDTDGDGITDDKEVRGYTVIIEYSNGVTEEREVTSNPYSSDTDGDGVTDYEEMKYGANPRDADTDADGLADSLERHVLFSNPAKQDTDEDGLNDGSEHDFFKTSLLLADSDGDQLSDREELLELNRNPRIADLPGIIISVGDVRLQIDERYSYIDEAGRTVTEESSSSTTLANSQNTSYTWSDQVTSEFTYNSELKLSASGAEYTGSYGGKLSAGWQEAEASARKSQQTYERSLTKGRELNTTRTVSREIVGARIDVDLTLSNTGNIPFAISNIEITVLQQAAGRDSFLPVATLVSNSELITGTPLVVNLGALNAERGPFLFASREVFPNLVEAIMRNPRGLVFRVANYDVSDELGRNYAFINQVALDRTGSITIDYGDAEAAARYLVATNGAIDDGGYTAGSYVGGFNSVNGTPLGLPINYVLQNILGIAQHDSTLDRIVPGTNGTLESDGINLQGDDIVQLVNGINIVTAGANGWLETRPVGDDFIANATSANGIVAGLNKTADSIAQGDDIQLVPVNTTGLSVGTIVIDPGENGALDTPMLADDKADFVYGYETSRSCSALSDKAGDICRVDNDCTCQPGDSDARCINNPAPAGSCSGPQRLVRVKSLRNGDFNRGWFVLTTGDLPAAADFNQILVDPGDSLTLAFLQDLDNDGLFARNEFLFGSTDSSRDSFDNSEFGENFDAATTAGPDGIPDSVDSDHDGLSDYAEAYVGWRVAADGGALQQVFSSPRFPDSDGDGLLDPVEQDLRRYCEPGDPRIDALCAFQSETVPIADAIGIIAGPDGTANTGEDGFGNSTLSGDDEQLVAYGTTGLAYGTAIIGPGTDGIMETALQGDDVYESLTSIQPATDPSTSDTDLDGISDYTELNGFDTSVAIVDGGNGDAETAKNGDDIQRAFVGNPVVEGSIVMLPGANGIMDSTPLGDDYIRDAITGLTADPLRRDTDNDDVADGLELARGSNPVVADGNDFTDSDQDGLTDNEETALGWSVTVDGGAAFLVNSSPYLADTDFDGLPDFVERDLRINPNNADTDGDGISDYDEINDLSKYATIAALYPNLNITSTTTSGYGTDPANPDTDNDGLTDKQELIDGFRFVIPGTSDATIVYTQAIYADTDLDGVNDGDEISIGTDPTNPDTDGDGRSDGAEQEVGSDPLVPDVSYRVIFRDISTNDGCTDKGSNPGELMWWVVLDNSNLAGKVLLSDALDAEKLQLDWEDNEKDENEGAKYYGDQNPVISPHNARGCYLKHTYERNYWMNFNKKSDVYTLKQGDSVNIQAMVVEGDGDFSPDCGEPPNFIPTYIQSSNDMFIMNKTYFYEDLANASTGITITIDDALAIKDTAACTINYNIDIEIIR